MLARSQVQFSNQKFERTGPASRDCYKRVIADLNWGTRFSGVT